MMSEQKRERKLTGPWAQVQTAIWLIGIAIIAWQNWWWPGILVLVAISLITQAILMRFSPQSFVEVEQPAAIPSESALMPAPDQAPVPLPVQEHRLELLPGECPRCGGPIRGDEVKWTGPQSADCPFCGSNLPMNS